MLGIFNVIIYIFLFSSLPIRDLQGELFTPERNFSAYLVHFVLLFTNIFYLYLLIKNTLKLPAFPEFKTKYALWVLSIFAVVILSQELIVQGVFLNSGINAERWLPLTRMDVNSEAYFHLHADFLTSISRLKTQIVKVGFPILWGVISFLLLIVGIKKDWKQLRIIALSLLGITIIKLFMYDINDASETGKIIAFILLGVLILIISFVYQKLKKLVSDQPKNTEDEEIK